MEIANNVLRQKLERYENDKVRKIVFLSQDKSQTTLVSEVYECFLSLKTALQIQMMLVTNAYQQNVNFIFQMKYFNGSSYLHRIWHKHSLLFFSIIFRKQNCPKMK